MLKKKTISAIIAGLSCTLCAAAFAPGVTFASADGPTADFVTVVEDGFVYADATNTTITDFNLPADIAGYFEIAIPEGVTQISANSFVATDNAMMTNYFVAVGIPSTVTAIEPNAFVNCTGILEVCNESEVDGVADTGLAGAVSTVASKSAKTLKTVTDENGAYLRVRNGGAGSAAWTLVSYSGTAEALTLPAPSVLNEACESYDVYGYAFAGSGIKSLVVPAYVTSLGARSFSGNAQLKNVTFEEGVESIGAAAFYGTGLTSIQIPASVTEIGATAFSGCAALSDLAFAKRADTLTIHHYAFEDCTGLRTVRLPDYADVRQHAFAGCSSLLWVYTGSHSRFYNNGSAEGSADAAFFPANTNLKIVYPTVEEYDAMLAQTEASFKNSHGAAATYLVNVNCYIGASTEPVVYTRLHGSPFNYVSDGEGVWHTDTAYSALPAQAAHYASTVWYGERDLKTAIDVPKVNELLLTESDIDLYCFETVSVPVLPVEPVSWVYDKNVAYDRNNLSEVLTAMGCTQQFTDAQLSALKLDVVYADADGKAQETPDTISGSGAYGITVSLDSAYGAWIKDAASTITVNVDTGSFNVVLIVLLVVGGLAVAVTVTTAILRKRVQKKSKKKQLSSKDVLEKFRAVGGETTLK